LKCDRSLSALILAIGNMTIFQEVPEKFAERVMQTNSNGNNGNGK
jgi:hypothetical protein